MRLGSQQRYEARAKIARALAHPTRLMFLDAMNRKGESNIDAVVNESGLEIRPVYDSEDVAASGGSGGIGKPGEFPFGFRPTLALVGYDAVIQHPLG